MANQGITRRSIEGFSLLELMVTISIAAVIMAVGIPSFKSSMDNQRMTAATNDLVMTMNLAKSEAIKRVAYVTVCKSSDGASCTAGSDWDDGWIVFANSTNANLNQVDIGDEIIRVFPALDDRLTIRSTAGVATFLSFRPSGTIGTSGGNIAGSLTACDERGGDYARAVNLQASGQWGVSHDTDHAGSRLSCG